MLIKTKLQIPPLRPRMLNRRRLLEKLSSGGSHRLTLISGHAGSGKTSLVCQWIKQRRLWAAWYSLDEADNDPDLFLRYFLTAFSSRDKFLAKAFEPWLQDPKRLSESEVLPAVIEHLTKQPKNRLLVLDDYHLINSKEIHQVISHFLQYIPPKTYVVIISRYGLPFSLSQFKVHDHVIEISSSDLKFNKKETEQFFSEIIPLGLSEEQMQKLIHYTEGWVGGMQLVGLTLRERDLLGGFKNFLAGTHHAATDYLMEEVLNAQPIKVKTFIHKIVFLDRFNAEVCREVTGMDDATEILHYLHRNNLFLIPLDPERTWYRYHHLFSEALSEQVKISTPGLSGEVHRTAALWFARNDYLEDAFQHAFASEDHEFAADLLEDHCKYFQEHYEIAFGLRWLGKLPQEIFRKRAFLRLHECSLKIESLQLRDIETELMEIEEHQTELFERYEGSKKTACHDLLLYLKYVLLPFYRDYTILDVAKLNEVMRSISPERNEIKDNIKVIIGANNIFNGNFVLVNDTLNEVSRSIFSSESVWARIMWYVVMLTAELLQGELNRAEALLKESFEFLERKGLSHTPFKFIIYPLAGWLFFHRNNLEKALEYTTLGLRYSEQSGLVNNITGGKLLYVFIYLAMGNLEKADLCIKEMQRISKEIDTRPLFPLDSVLGAISALRGDLRTAEQWAEQRKLSMSEPFSIGFAYECLFKTTLFCTQRKYLEAIQMLEELRHRCVQHNMKGLVLQTDLILSSAFYNLNDRERAKTSMEQALHFSETENFIRPFVIRASLISPVLTDMVKSLPKEQISPHLMTILKACNIYMDSKATSNLPMGKGPLTSREIDILKLIAAGYKNKEIAEKTFVSFETVKTHTKNIFKKLDVSTRIHAVRRAEDLKLL